VSLLFVNMFHVELFFCGKPMSLDLAFLVTTRAPLRGDPYRALLYLAMSANSSDIVHASLHSVKVGCRLDTRRTQAAFFELLRLGYLVKFRMGASNNPFQRYYIVARELLMVAPVLNPKSRKFAGEPVAQLNSRARANMAAILADRAEILKDWLMLEPSQRKSFLERIGRPDPAPLD
jgi:hypothetical protein